MADEIIEESFGFLGIAVVELLSLLVTVLDSICDVRLETIAEALPLPLLFENRRKKFNGSLF